MMKKVLFIAPACFPVNGAEAIVNVKLLQTLLKSGKFEVDVVSKKSKHSNYPSNSLDDYGLSYLHIHIVEVDNKVNLRTIWASFMCIFEFGVTMQGAHWAYAALPKVKNLVNNKKYDYVLTKNAPSFLLGHYLQSRYGMKWVASWNDPYPREKYPAPYGKGWAYKNLIVNSCVRVMSMADIHIFPNTRLKNWMQKYLMIHDDKTLIVPHVMHNQSLNRPECKGTLKIIHSGNLKKPRNPEMFIRALHKLLLQDNDCSVELVILGVADDDTKQLINELNLGDCIHFLGNVSYQESILLLANYHVAVIIEADCKEGIFLPTKVADYMSVGIPIMSLSPKEGVLNDLYINGQISYFAEISNEESILSCLRNVWYDFNHGGLHEAKTVNEYSPDYVVGKYLSI